MAHMDPNLMTKDMKAKFTELKAWAKARVPDKDTLMSPAFMALVAVPLLVILVSLRAHVFGKEALLHYEPKLRFSVEYGWLCACCTIAAYILSRPLKHLKPTKVVLFIFGLLSVYTLYFDVHGYYNLFAENFYSTYYDMK